MCFECGLGHLTNWIRKTFSCSHSLLICMQKNKIHWSALIFPQVKNPDGWDAAPSAEECRESVHKGPGGCQGSPTAQCCTSSSAAVTYTQENSVIEPATIHRFLSRYGTAVHGVWNEMTWWLTKDPTRSPSSYWLHDSWPLVARRTSQDSGELVTIVDHAS
jgi:hypothetical protein